MRSIVADLVAWSVGRSVCRFVCYTSELCKNGWTDQDAVSVEDSGGPRKPCIRWGPDPHGKGQFWGERGVPFGLWTRVGRRKHEFTCIRQVAPMCPHGKEHCPPMSSDDMGGHIGSTWRIRLNRPSAVAMQSYVKVLWPLVKELETPLYRKTDIVSCKQWLSIRHLLLNINKEIKT